METRRKAQWTLPGDDGSVCEVNEMGKDVTVGSGHESGRRVGVDRPREGPRVGRAFGEGGADRGLSGTPVCRERGDACGGVGDGIAVARVDPPGGQPCEAVERGHVGPHVAVRRRDERRGPAHHRIPGEDGIAPDKSEVVCEMPGSVQNPQ